MTEGKKKYLLDIRQSIFLIEGFIVDTKSFKTYTKDFKTKAAVERHLAIIGEALNKLQKEDNSVILNSSSQIISLRNRLIHAYDSIDDSIIWAILQRHLKPLSEEVTQLLNPQ